MSFLTPLFFLGALAIAVPILIHLTQKEKKTIVEFPSLMFLRQIAYTSVRRRSIRDLWLLALRILAILLMMLAFSRPWFRSGAIAANLPGSTRDVVILLDRSASMGYGDRFARAKTEARKIAGGLSGEDRATLVLFGSNAEENVRASSDRARLSQAIDLATVGAEATRFGPALRLAQSLLAQSAMPRREAVLISDFQKLGWERQEEIHLPEGAILTPVSVGGGETADVAVTSVTFARNQFSGQDRVVATAGVVNRSANPAADVPVALEVDGHLIETKKLTVAPGASGSVTFAEFTVAEANVRGKVSAASGDSWTANNDFFFVLSPSRPVSVLVVQSDGAGRDANLYVTTALGIGDAPKFAVETIAASKLTGAQAENRAVIVLNDVAVLPTGGVDILKRFVERGGGLFVSTAGATKWSETEQTTLMPGVIGAPVDRPSGRVGALGYLDYSHPVFEVFRTPRAGGFSGVHFFRYRALDAKTFRVLARFDDGGAAMVERQIGAGRVVAWTTSLDSSWNDLAVKPAFLPFIRQIATVLSGFQNSGAWQTAGRALDLTAKAKVGEGLVTSPSGRRSALSDTGKPAFVELHEQGFYTIRLNQEPAGTKPQAVAVNIDPAETDLSSMDLQEFSARVTGRADDSTSQAPPTDVPPADAERRQGIWWYLLLLGAAVLVAEAWLSNRLSKGPGMIQSPQV